MTQVFDSKIDQIGEDHQITILDNRSIPAVAAATFTFHRDVETRQIAVKLQSADAAEPVNLDRLRLVFLNAETRMRYIIYVVNPTAFDERVDVALDGPHTRILSHLSVPLARVVSSNGIDWKKEQVGTSTRFYYHGQPVTVSLDCAKDTLVFRLEVPRLEGLRAKVGSLRNEIAADDQRLADLKRTQNQTVYSSQQFRDLYDQEAALQKQIKSKQVLLDAAQGTRGPNEQV